MKGEKNMERKPITVRPVEGFDPYDYVFRQRDEITGNPVISEITGEEKKYLLVKAQKVWFQRVFPEGSIQTTYIPRDDGQHQFHARIYQHRDDAQKATPENPDAGAIATADALRLPAHGEKYSAFETAQTMAISYALENAGFGSEIALQIASQERGEVIASSSEIGTPERASAPDPVSDEEIMKMFSTPSEPEPESASEIGSMEDAIRAFAGMLGVEPEMLDTESAKEKPEAEPVKKPAETEEEEEFSKEQPEKKAEKVEKPKEEAIENAGDYIITAEDVVGVPPLERYVGSSLGDIGLKDVTFMFENVGDKLSEKLRSAAEKFIEEK